MSEEGRGLLRRDRSTSTTSGPLRSSPPVSRGEVEVRAERDLTGVSGSSGNEGRRQDRRVTVQRDSGQVVGPEGLCRGEGDSRTGTRRYI